MNCSMNAIRQTSVPSLALLIIVIASGGCSKRNDETANHTVAATPLVTAAPADQSSTSPIRTEAGGVPAVYTPYYEGSSLKRITEVRTSGERPDEGEYLYRGARLLRYSGAAMQGGGSIHLEFDLQGALVSANKSDGPAPEDEIAAVRRRAQLLRSHALAQRATHTHRVK